MVRGRRFVLFSKTDSPRQAEPIHVLTTAKMARRKRKRLTAAQRRALVEELMKHASSSGDDPELFPEIWRMPFRLLPLERSQQLVPASALPDLARKINEAHNEATLQAKSALFAAKRAGELLLQAKEDKSRTLPFKEWVETETALSYRTAARYMTVATGWSRLKGVNVDTLSDALVVLGQADPRPRGRVPQLAKPDAQHAIKLQTMASEVTNENEAAVAREKLERFATERGMTSEQVVERSRRKLGLPTMEGPSGSLKERLQQAPKAKLVKLLVSAASKHPDLVEDIDAALGGSSPPIILSS
jgi:hypothetical protein